MFAAGAAIGSAVTWKIVKTQYERIVQEELESIKEAFAGNDPAISQEQTDDESDGEDDTAHQINWDELEDLDDDDDEQYAPTEYELNTYTNIANNYTGEKGGAENMADNVVHVHDVAKEPYIISPYDFGELDGYKQIELTYYEGDDTLEDDEYNIINDRDELIGPKALLTFGEYEDDSVFVRNERLRTDFQILKDYRSYTDARSIGPNQVDDE
jgi:hypothetical protein